MSLPNYQDGYFLPDRETTVEPTLGYPFAEYPTPDPYSRDYTREYEVLPRLYRPRIANRTAWTNLVTYSEQFDNAAWTKTNLTVTPDVATAPDGQATMDKVLETATNAEHSVSQAATVAAVATEAFVFAQGGLGRTFIRVAFTDSAAAVFYAFFDIVGGNVGAVSAGVTAKVVAIGGGQYQCVMGFIPAAGAGTLKINIASSVSVISYAGNTSDGAYLWGAQVATGTNAPYISTATTTRAVSAPDRELTINGNAPSPDPLSYLISETQPKNLVSTVATVQRRFSRVPTTQVRYSSTSITKPTIPSQGSAISSGTTLNLVNYDQPAVTVATAVYNAGAFWGADYRVFYPIRAGSWAVTDGTASAGTFTITYKTSTTGALAYNATIATIAAAINALTDVVSDGLTVSAGSSANQLGTAGQILLILSAGTTSSPFTMNPAGLTVNTSQKAWTRIVSSTSQNLSITSHIGVTAHGLTNTGSLLIFNQNGTGFVIPSSTWAVKDANTLQVPNETNIVGGGYGVIVYAGTYLRTYTPGATMVACTVTERYYLPNVTAGITTPADIPIAVPYISDSAIIKAVLNTTGFQAFAFSGPDQWNGPIYRTVETDINFSTIG